MRPDVASGLVGTTTCVVVKSKERRRSFVSACTGEILHNVYLVSRKVRRPACMWKTGTHARMLNSHGFLTPVSIIC